VPSLTHQARWPYSIVGVGFALLGITTIAYGFTRQREVRKAIMGGKFAHPNDKMLIALTVGGVVLGLMLLLVVAIQV
jgi:uncharacterized membrane protein YidH (DUF202 family)